MTYNFDEYIERRGTDSSKWSKYDEDVLPMWVADMDFRSPEPILQALHERITHGVFGYGGLSSDLTGVICDRMASRYDWTVTPEQVVLMPGIISSFNVACRAFGESGMGVLVQPPVYHPILAAPGHHGMTADMAELTLTHQGNTLYYEFDDDVFEAAITPQTRMFLLCSPHNPVGRSYTRPELTRMAEICDRYDLIICSDEIHCELMMAGNRHAPVAAIDPAISARTITLMAPSKTFNIPGLGFSFAIVQNPDLMARLKTAMAGIVPHPKLMGSVAALAAYTQGDEWLTALLTYLTENRDYLVDYVTKNFPNIKTTIPEATYLAWLDCRGIDIEGFIDPDEREGSDGQLSDFFLEKARVGLSEGAWFGQGGEGFLRLNYGCPRALLKEGLERLRRALRD